MVTLSVRTLTVPVASMFAASWYEYDDSSSNRREYVLFGASVGDAKRPVSDTIRCCFVSLFFQVTVSPGLIWTSSGAKPVAVIEIVVVAVFWAEAAEATPATASTVISSRSARFMLV